MEAADIAFRADGTGWTYWPGSGGTFFVRRFTWHTTAGRQLTLDLHRELSGTWDCNATRPRTASPAKPGSGPCHDRGGFLAGSETARRTWVAGQYKSWTGYVRGGAAW